MNNFYKIKQQQKTIYTVNVSTFNLRMTASIFIAWPIEGQRQSKDDDYNDIIIQRLFIVFVRITRLSASRCISEIMCCPLKHTRPILYYTY